MEYKHEIFFAEEGITSFKGWPPSIMGKLTTWKQMKKKYGDNPTPAQAEDLRIRSVEIADESLTFIERDLADEEEIQNTDTMTEQQTKQLNDAKAKAAQAKTAKDWKAAIAAYKEGLSVDDKDADCIAGIAECETAITDDAAATEATRLETNYNSLIATGDEAYGRKDYATAKSAYTNALGIKKDEAYPTDQLKKIESDEATQAANATQAAADAATEASNKKHRATGTLFGGIYK